MYVTPPCAISATLGACELFKVRDPAAKENAPDRIFSLSAFTSLKVFWSFFFELGKIDKVRWGEAHASVPVCEVATCRSRQRDGKLYRAARLYSIINSRVHVPQPG
jgi:hypothetical protein